MKPLNVLVYCEGVVASVYSANMITLTFLFFVLTGAAYKKMKGFKLVIDYYWNKKVHLMHELIYATYTVFCL